MTQNTTPTRDEVIQMASDAGAARYTNRHYPDRPMHTFNPEQLQAFAASAAAAESQRADALAATIAALCALVTTDTETKAEFVARVRGVLGEDPDLRLVRVVEDMRERCAKAATDADHMGSVNQKLMKTRVAAAIHALPAVSWIPPQPATGATLYWDADDGEDGPSHDIESLLNNIVSNRDLAVGDEIQITRAIQLPDMRVRVTGMPEDDDIQYEVINDGSKGGAA